jgi:hypothetical protein
VATGQEKSHDRDITWKLRARRQAPEHISKTWISTTWIIEVIATGSRDGKPFQATHHWFINLRTYRCDTSLRTYRCDTSLRTTPEALLQLVRDRWNIEAWHWIRDTQLHEDDHRFRGNGAGAMAMLRTAALNLLRLAGLQLIQARMQAVMHDITALLAMAMKQPNPEPI